MPDCTIVVPKPAASDSTKPVFGKLKLDEMRQHPDIDAIVRAINDGDLGAIADHMGNVLETVTIRDYPVIGEIKELMKTMGARGALMSGSGPTVFGIFDDEAAAKNVWSALKNGSLARQVFLTRPVNVSQ